STNTNLLLDLFRRSRKSPIFYSALFLYDEGWKDLSLKNSGFSRAGLVQPPENAESYALEGSTAQELQNLTRGNVPSLRNRRISRAATFHRSVIAESHALERSTAQELRNPTRGNVPPLRNCRIPRAATFHRSEIAESHAR